MKKILLSILFVGAVAVVAVFATRAFFNDTETSTGNKFVAGKLDLKIDNTCHYNGAECKLSEDNKYHWDGVISNDECFCTWQKKDLTNELFFNFPDIKPGDNGEDTVSLHVDNNDAWVCAEVENLANDDNGCVEPESDIDKTCGIGEGELGSNLLFTVWKDINCDNILDREEQVLVNSQSAQEGFWPIADSSVGLPLKGDSDYCLGVKWNVPLDTGNIIQSDSVVGDISFYAVQSRNIPEYICTDGGGCIPSKEICDGKDNNCNGNIDEGNVCVEEPTPTLTPIPTQVPTQTPLTEICGDGIDNDQNGQTDEGCTPWINEIHYDNLSDDTNEGIEIAGRAGINLSGWYVVLYNGGDGSSYSTPLNLSGTIANQQSGFGTEWFDKSGIQNGSPDGIALVAPDNTLIQFLSYEGSFTATDGPANGIISTDIGVKELGTETNKSLQLTGTGNKYSDFVWGGPIDQTHGLVNTGQTFN